MVKLECIEEGCPYLTQDLEFDQAEKILVMHLNRAHPAPVVSPGVSAAVSPVTSVMSTTQPIGGALVKFPASKTKRY